MGLFDWMRRLLGGVQADQPSRSSRAITSSRRPRRRKHPTVVLTPFGVAGKRSRKAVDPRFAESPVVASRPYRFARFVGDGRWLDLSQDERPERLERFNLPRFRHPEELAKWLDLPVGQLAWLSHRFDESHRPAEEKAAHYHYRWIGKRSGGNRLIEAPKPRLKRVQARILHEILNRVPPHVAAHGFAAGRSIRTNAQPHVGSRVVVKLDLQEFYPSVSFNRVVAIFRSLGYSREVAIWLGRLTTAALPASFLAKGRWTSDMEPYQRKRLPQGAPTSPALANLSAFALDLRLGGLARSFGARYTRYADDLTFSGDERFLRSLAVFIPLAEKIIRSERFTSNKKKRRVIRSSQRQTVTGVVVNARPNVARRDYDLLKAILTNCIRRGPSTQNHDRHPNFAAHLMGRIAHVSQLNPARGEKLRVLYGKIDWNR